MGGQGGGDEPAAGARRSVRKGTRRVPRPTSGSSALSGITEEDARTRSGAIGAFQMVVGGSRLILSAPGSAGDKEALLAAAIGEGVVIEVRKGDAESELTPVFEVVELLSRGGKVHVSKVVAEPSARERAAGARPGASSRGAGGSTAGGDDDVRSVRAVSGLVQQSLRQHARLVSLAETAGLDVETLLAALERSVLGSGERMFTQEQVDTLTEAGVDLSGPAEVTTGAVLGGIFETQRLRSWARTVDEVADLLGVTAGRVRQRMADRELVALRGDGPVLLPAWQFVDGGVVPHLDEVLDDVEPWLHPLTVERFMQTPQPDLLVEDRPVSPVTWLSTGGDPEPVAELLLSLTVGG